MSAITEEGWLFDLLKYKAKVRTIYTRQYLFLALRNISRNNVNNHKAHKKPTNQK